MVPASLTPIFAAAVDRTPVDLAEEPVRAASAGGGGGAIARVVIGLLVVVAAIWALRWVLEQVRASREGQAAGAGLTALSSLPLGPGRAVHLVRAGDELVLLGVAEQGITPIRTYSEHEAREVGLLGEDGTPAATTASTPAIASLVQTLRARTVRR